MYWFCGVFLTSSSPVPVHLHPNSSQFSNFIICMFLETNVYFFQEFHLLKRKNFPEYLKNTPLSLCHDFRRIRRGVLWTDEASWETRHSRGAEDAEGRIHWETEEGLPSWSIHHGPVWSSKRYPTGRGGNSQYADAKTLHPFVNILARRCCTKKMLSVPNR